ncbi:MAG: hypothetical protein GY932_00820 [Arcobacter sp.]|nr:hypothetical protein [Arcobacter sp.]
MLREYDIELSYEEYANQYAGIPTTSNAVTIVENYSIDTSPAELVKAKNMLPDCYLLAAEKLGLEPSECLAIEVLIMEA